ncbi:MAG: hypothetical protein Q9169_002088 [Polycauliona sp. 2 TL-2023]
MAAPPVPASKVLITGCSGFVGFSTLLATLDLGWRVLGVVPTREDADRIILSPALKRLGDLDGNLTFIIIPDIAADNSLAEAVKLDVEYIIHTDSPMTVSSNIPTVRYDSQIIQPILKGTNNVLSAARSNANIKRVVMTLSLMSIVEYWSYIGGESFATYDNRSPVAHNTNPPYTNALNALCAGKAKALAMTQTFLAKNKPHFTVINLLPGHVVGHDVLAKTSKDLNKGSNQQTLRHLRGEDVSTNMPSQTVFIDDVAKVHALALNTKKIAGSQNFVLTSHALWYRPKEIVKEEYKDAVKKGWLSLGGEQPSNPVKVEAGASAKAFNIKFAGFDKQIRSLLDQWVHFKAKEEEKE